MSLRSSLALVALLLAVASTAAADDAPPTELMVLPKGKLVINGFVEINLSSRAAFKPVSLTPDVWYGVDDKLTLGLVHSSIGATGFIGGVADSLCVAGRSNGCLKVYRNVAAKARYRLKVPWTIDAGLLVANVSSPFLLDLEGGASRRWRKNKLVIEFQPNLVIALNNRNTDTTLVAPRSERLNLPATVGYEVAPKVVLNAQAGLSVPFNGAGGYYTVPFSVGGRYTKDAHLSFGLMFALPALLKGSALSGGASVRTLILGVTYAR